MTYVRALLIVFWLVSPAVFLFLYVRGERASLMLRRGNARSWFAASSVAINYIMFAALLIRAQTPYGMIFPTSIFTHVLLSASCAGVILGVRKWPLLMANVALTTLWIVIAYAPTHWLRKTGPATVTVDGQLTDGTFYFGYPTDSEAEAIALVEIPGIGDYFLSFGEEKVRLAPGHEFIHLPGGIWDFKSLRQMDFSEQLQPKKSERFRFVAANGRVVEVPL